MDANNNMAKSKEDETTGHSDSADNQVIWSTDYKRSELINTKDNSSAKNRDKNTKKELKYSHKGKSDDKSSEDDKDWIPKASKPEKFKKCKTNRKFERNSQPTEGEKIKLEDYYHLIPGKSYVVLFVKS